MSTPRRFSGDRFVLEHHRFSPTPYCNYHAWRLGVPRWRSDLMFEKWNRRPHGAKALYWRLHPGERCGLRRLRP